MARQRNTKADDLFREAARQEGYLDHGGKGLWAWYRDNGILPPEVLERVIPSREYTNWSFEHDDIGDCE